MIHMSVRLLVILASTWTIEAEISAPQIQDERCPDPLTYWNPCGDPCRITCENKDKLRICPDECISSGACVCRDGLVRDYRGRCISPEECPTCSGPNEVFACGSACDTTCATLGEVCPIVNIVCNEMCYCIDGYARNDDNICIPIKECPPKKCNKKNEEYVHCPPSCPPEETCSFYLSGMTYDCAPEDETRKCIPRCQCKAGFLRNEKTGECVKPNGCCRRNEEAVACPSPCPGGTCESPDFAPCLAPCKIRGCQCKKGYVKDAKGNCILLSKCPA